MPNHHKLHLHLDKRRQKTILDKVVAVAVFLYPMSGIPQAMSVLQGNVAGISLISWVAFIGFSTLFLAYGIVHKVKPMIVVNLLWIIIYCFIVIGTIFHRMAN